MLLPVLTFLSLSLLCTQLLVKEEKEPTPEKQPEEQLADAITKYLLKDRQKTES